ADVEVLVPREDERDGVLHLLFRDRLIVYLERTGAALTDAARAAERERSHAETVVLEVELDRMFARGQYVGGFPLDAFQVDQVPGEHRLALEDVETVASEAPPLGDQHTVAAALRNFDLCLEVVRRVQERRRVAVGRTGERCRPGEDVPAGCDARARREQA